MSKILPQYENPIDNFNIYLSNELCPLFKKMNFTPNGITTLSLLFGLISIVLLWKGYILAFAITYYISYFFDCMDGHYARKYKMVSKGGDIYDHVKDVSVNILLIFVVIYKYIIRKKIDSLKLLLLFLFIVSITILMTAHLGCQELLYPKKDESGTLNFSKQLCFGDPEKTIRFTRFFGCGSWIVLVILSIVWLDNSAK